MRITLITIFIGFTLIGCNVNTTSYKPESRNIYIVNDSVKIYANIFLKPYKGKLKDNLQYYWYSSDVIGKNFGGYNGYLLCDSYKKINFKGNLLEKGQFINGLKDGVWKFWYTNGNLKRIEVWKKGVIEANVISYNIDGSSVNLDNNINSTISDTSAIKKAWYKKLFRKDKKNSK